MSADWKPPRGTQDILPPLSERFDAHQRRSAAIFERAGYRSIVTPMFEDTSLFVRGVGEGSDIVTKEMYSFTDRSGNPLTLRPEGTSSVMRAVISNHLWDEGLPIKLWYAAAMFRYDRPQKGRYRQHHQLGIEAIGTDDPAIDAEVLQVAREMLGEAGVTQTTLHLNSIGHPGPDCRDVYRPELVAFLEGHRDDLDDDCRRRMTTNPLRVFDCKDPRDQALLADAPVLLDRLCDACRAHFETVQGYLKDLGIDYEIAPRLVRGLDYYTRTTFEYQTPLLEAAQNTVCGGGRYDLLSEMLGGPPLPGIGFGAGVERVLLAQEAAGNAPERSRPECFVVPLGAEERPIAFRLVGAIRARGLAADMAFGDRSLKAHLTHANRLGARFAALIGAAERERGVATVRDMGTGEQSEVALDSVAAWLEDR